MTNKEILQADLLDILFEHRNKLYGAYALRRTYARRLGLALGAALSIVLFSLLMSFVKKKDNSHWNAKHDDIVQLTNLEIPPDKPKEPEPPIERPRAASAQVDYQAPEIVEDDKVKDALPDLNDIINADISNKTLDGEPANKLAGTTIGSEGEGDTEQNEPPIKNDPPLPSRDPGFPGGPAAWLKFLQRYLKSPADVEPGQRIEVQVRFWVDVDGSISRTEILKSGGDTFDKEVLRVLKKMPKWEPALQAGRPIAVAFHQPVIFVGEEQ